MFKKNSITTITFLICILLYVIPHSKQYYNTHKPASWIIPAFEHAGLLHLFFNMYWLLLLGPVVEQKVGKAWLVFIIILLSAISNTLQFIASGPLFLGFSGVLYGLVAFLYVLYPNNRSIISISRFFIGFLIFGVILTYFNIIKLGNYSHAGGAVAGLLLAHIYNHV